MFINPLLTCFCSYPTCLVGVTKAPHIQLHRTTTSFTEQFVFISCSQISVSFVLVQFEYLHFLQYAVEAGCFASSWGSRDVKAAGEALQDFLLQERSYRRPLSLPGQKALGHSGMKGLLHALKPRLWRTNTKVKL